MEKPIVALLYDFDNTLITRDMQEFTFIPSVGMEPKEFWEFANELAVREKMDGVLAYMYGMIECSRRKNEPLRREALVECGRHVEYYPGVETWFDRINRIGEEAGVTVEHYVLSSGLKEIIEGSSIAKYFKCIFASEFLYHDNCAVWAKLSVNYTSKTQFVYRINKGVLDISNDGDLNKSVPENNRRVKFSNMIYLGDGLTDVPCMKLVKSAGGHSIALYKAGKKEKVLDFLQHERVDFIFESDYSEGSHLEKAMRNILQKLAIDNRLAELNASQKQEKED